MNEQPEPEWNAASILLLLAIICVGVFCAVWLLIYIFIIIAFVGPIGWILIAGVLWGVWKLLYGGNNTDVGT